MPSDNHVKSSIMNSRIILYQTNDGETKVEVNMDGETVWLTQNQMAELFEK